MELHPDTPVPHSVLLIDDEQPSVDSLASILRQEHYVVHSATSGEVGLRILRDEKIDLVLLDVSMPDMDGFETLSRIRVHKATKEIPVIFLTGYMRDSSHMDRGFRLGVNEYLVKPIEPSELLVRVSSILRMTIAEKTVKELQKDFFSMLVHDLRGPLSAIHAFAELLLEEPEPGAPERREMLGMTLSACDHMISIISDILDLSKLESRYVTLNREKTDLREAIRRSLQRMHPLAANKSIIVETVLPDDTITADIDERKIEQVVENLIGNALKFVHTAGRIVVTARRLDAPDERLKTKGVAIPAALIEVQDNGTGIPAHELPLLFDKYRQISTARLSAAKGTGLGLAICKNIVEAHGGHIWAESTVGQGSTFAFCIPLESAETR